MYFIMEIVDIQLDATTELETASQFRIRGYPTVLLVYKVGSLYDLQFSRPFLCIQALAKLLKWQREQERRWNYSVGFSVGKAYCWRMVEFLMDSLAI